MDKRGIFSVKSGYRVALEDRCARQSPSCSQPSLQKWWAVLWNLLIPPKVKFFIWRACLEALPTKANLERRKILRDGSCDYCNQAVESGFHVLVSCHHAQLVWQSFEKGSFLLQLRVGRVLDVLLEVLKVFGVQVLAECCMIMWCLWGARNAKVHQVQCFEQREVVSKALAVLREFQHTRLVCSVSPTLSSPSPGQVWSPPAVDCLKLNSDTAVKPGKDVVGLGAAVRNHLGAVVLAMALPWCGFLSPEAGEFLALREGLRAAFQLGLQVEVIEVDSVAVASAVNSSVSFRGANSLLIDDIQALCKVVEVDKCKAIPRSENRLAHRLAFLTLTLSSSEALYWQNINISCIFPCECVL